MNAIRITMQQVQVNIKFLNALPSKWSKFVTDVKLAKSLYTTNYDQLYAYLSQHEQHANEVRIMRERYPDPLALVANSPTLYNLSQSPQNSGEDPIECINKAMAFLSTVASRFPPSNNQLRTSSNPRNQATIQHGRVTVQQVQGRQTQSYAGTGNKGIATTSKGNFTTGQPRVMKCYNCEGEGHMVRQCTQPKIPRNAAWFKEKLMLAEAQEAGQILDEEQLAFLAGPGISEAPVAQQIIPQNSAFQTKNLDAYDSDCDDLSSAKAVLMANLLSCDPEFLSEVPYSNSYPNDMINQDMQEMKYSKQTYINDFQDNEIHKSKEKESRYIDKEIVLEKQNKELENIIYKMYRSTQEMHMLTKPLVFYDDTHKQALGYQNPFHLIKAQQIQPTLYDGSVIAKEHAVISITDDEETLILEEESRSKMFVKQNDPISIEKKIKISPIDYSKLNKIKEDFGKRFVTQK
ncbi:retrovirus-related pol polyprotein from transposon TNT 1-94 [Tanacetum coccineum]